MWKETLMYHRMIGDYLTYYQPDLKVELISNQELAAYIERQEQSMITAREQLLAQLQEKEPHLSQWQREMEADQTVREVFLPMG